MIQSLIAPVNLIWTFLKIKKKKFVDKIKMIESILYAEEGC